MFWKEKEEKEKVWNSCVYSFEEKEKFWKNWLYNFQEEKEEKEK